EEGSNLNRRTTLADTRFQFAPQRFAFARHHVLQVGVDGAVDARGVQIGVHFAFKTQVDVAIDLAINLYAGAGEWREGDINGAINNPHQQQPPRRRGWPGRYRSLRLS